MDKYSDYLLNQINEYRESLNGCSADEQFAYKCIVDELIQAFAQYQNSKVKPFIN
jgi:hypothetical protein